MEIDNQKNLNMDTQTISKTKIKQIQSDDASSILEDINILKKLYQKQKNPLVLNALIEKLNQDYQFDEAKKYMDVAIAKS
ncbi:MAG: hypothetical protein GXP45_02730 [bacterium]|nr:hypothetical protein [bacterium]